jgi:hypothetical protein
MKFLNNRRENDKRKIQTIVLIPPIWRYKNIDYTQSLYAMLKKPTAQIAHLVLQTHRQTLKNQMSYFIASALKKLSID